MARLYPVLEISGAPVPFWLPLVDGPAPQFVELGANTPHGEVLLALSLLSTYGHDERPASAAELADDFPTIAPGGLAASDGATTVHPSCCCGLEGWREWSTLLQGGASPWLGHDPSPWVERVGGEFVVWAEGGLGEAAVETGCVRFTRSELERGLADAASALEAFAGRLTAVLVDHRVAEAKRIGDAFREAFVVGRRP